MATSVLDPGGSSRDEAKAITDVVAVLPVWRERIAVLRRSAAVHHDVGLWHCVTGYVDEDASSARAQALMELWEETGLEVQHLVRVAEGPSLRLDGGGRRWRVHTYLAETTQRRLRLNWENDAYRWVDPRRLRRFDGRVPWLDDVVAALSGALVGPDQQKSA